MSTSNQILIRQARVEEIPTLEVRHPPERVSIIIPTRRRANRIDRCIRSLLSSDYPKDLYEIILVVNDASVGEYERFVNYGIKVTLCSEISPGNARDYGATIANGEIFVFTDDDVVVPPNWLKNGLKYFSDEKASLVGGPNLSPPDSSFLQKAIGITMASRLGSGLSSYRFHPRSRNPVVGSELMVASCNMMVRRTAFKWVQGFIKLGSCEENDLCVRLQKAGYKLIYAPDLIVWHERRSSIKNFFNQIRRSGRGRFFFLEKSGFGYLVKYPLFVFPSLMILYLINLPLLLLFHLYTLIPLALYFLLALGTGLWNAVKNSNWRFAIVVPFLILLQHIAYGLGFIEGLWKKTMDIWG